MAMAGYRGTMWLLPVVLLFLQMVHTVIPNACKVSNGNCEQFCKTEDEGVVCSCAAGYALGSDNKTCVPVVKFPCGKLQRSHEASQEKVTGTTASPDAHPENEETTEAPSSHPEVTREADHLPSASPWHAVLVNKYNEWFCGGTILNEYFILSAAHCIKQYKDIQVLVGMVDKEKEEPSRAMHRVEKIIPHAEFDNKTYDSDIALLKLEEPITFSEDVIPACLPEKDFANNILMSQTFGIVSGFGRTFERAQLVKRMKVLQIPYVNRRTCKLALYSPVTENMFCAGYDKDGRDACQGDGGGPHVTQYNGTYFVTGVISWGEGCGRQGKYGVYTKLSKFLPWVRSVLTEDS
ncbi:coagulation factor X-like [Grus americana]|uniref:coagulation factor X-like n=1 Tax=Grus americana TaxID=9117 RepID=UPI0024086F78|nr:coagulation factor X-like [Grus americana]